MLTSALILEIRDRCQEYWTQEVEKDYFLQVAQGKEIGHRIADLVDEKTAALLTVNYLTRYERHRSGGVRERSMGDIWLHEQGIYHPVNIKAGIAGRGGQPNMVSLKKLLRSLLTRRVDAYYLLMVKFDVKERLKPQIYFTDMLDHLDYVTFDSGPGQIMLKADKFFAAFDPDATRPVLSTDQKVSALLNLLEDGERRLRINRERGLESLRAEVDAYLQKGNFAVTPDTQKGLLLQ